MKLICSTSRVAPLKRLTIPPINLELCDALLLAELSEKVLKCMEFQPSKVILWSDSKIVLAYIRSSPSKFQTFVANK